MKKILICCSVISVICMTVIGFAKVSTMASLRLPLLKSDLEALSDCEITNSSGGVLFSCSGDGKCSETYLGKKLICDGTKN